MFQTPKVKSFLQKASLEGKDEKKVIRLVFYVTPIPFDLAEEVSPKIADRLFRKLPDGSWAPAAEVPGIRFDIGTIPPQTMEWHPANEDALDHTGVMTQGVYILNIHALKLFPDNPNFTLAFVAEVPLDSVGLDLMQKYFRREVFLTFADMQGELFPNDSVHDSITDPKCEYCDDRAIYRDKDKSYWCQKDVRRSTSEVTLLVTQETPAQAEKRILAEREAKAVGQASLVMEGTVKAAADKDDASFINKRNSKKRERVH